MPQINTLRYEPLLAVGWELSQCQHPLPRCDQKSSDLTAGQVMRLMGECLYLNSPSNPRGIHYFFLLEPFLASKRIVNIARAVIIASMRKVYPVQ
jgi:hypothetical protein